VWVFPIAITLHNLEEAVWLPSWSESAGRWHHPVGRFEFRFAVIVLTVVAFVVAYLCYVGGKQSIGAYLLTGYALAMFLNVFVPHLLATIFLKRYAPGTATAVLLNLPVTGCIIYLAITLEYVQVWDFLVYGPIVVLGLVACIPLLFAIGRRVIRNSLL
jgi:hypothetical protein